MNPDASSGRVAPLPQRPAGDPFAAIDADLELLDAVPLDEQLPIFGRVHTALTAALAATAVSGDGPPTHPGGR